MQDLFEKHRGLGERGSAAHREQSIGGEQQPGDLADAPSSTARPSSPAPTTIWGDLRSFLHCRRSAGACRIRHRHHRLHALPMAPTTCTSPSSARSPTLGRRHCIVFSTGYQANLGMIAGLARPKDTIYLDADLHFSIYDGCTCRALSSSASATMIPRISIAALPAPITKVAAWWCSRASTRWSATGRR